MRDRWTEKMEGTNKRQEVAQIRTWVSPRTHDQHMAPNINKVQNYHTPTGRGRQKQQSMRES